MPPKVTYIEDLPELDNFFDHKQQSMQGFPPRINPDFSSQINNEMSERDRTMKPMQGKIRQSSDFRTAINGGGMGGMPGMSVGEIVQQPFYPYNPQHHNQHNQHNHHNHNNHHHQPHDDYLLIEPNEDYKLGPRAQNNQNIQNIQNNQNDNQNSHREITCIEIAKHIKHCPICSKFYDTDKSLYIIIIIILIIFCALLLKKFLFVKET
uniref:LITAF domain-containing protein n=1 Tax=viral metagenome TaxID=1070528 RepID=A0A6C0KEY1_9ZZZZ